jgi:mannose-6-phosphate isomerase-like protein (cupin superfamily)
MHTPQIISTDEGSEYYFEEGCYIWEQSNSAVDEDLSIARARVLANTATKRHKLANTTERYIILEGTGEVILGENTITAVSKGDVVIIPPNCPQAINNTGTIDLVFMVLCTPRFIIENYSECE